MPKKARVVGLSSLARANLIIGAALRQFSVGRAVRTADAFASCFAAVQPGLLSGRSQQCCSPMCSLDDGGPEA